MPRKPNSFTALLCLTGFIVWSMLPGVLGLASGSGNAFLLEICTPSGVESLVLSQDSDQQAPTEKLAKNHCPFCQIKIDIIITDTSISLMLPPIIPALQTHIYAHTHIPQTIHIGSYATRAPPVSS